MISQISRPVLCGSILAGAYALCVAATLTCGAQDAQLATTIFTAPTSTAVLEAANPALELIHGYESAARQAAVWILILLAGFAQYFLLGFGLTKLWYHIDRQ